jgi:cupin superfamily acireductone dioxygenase involved in methionine salvage
MEKQIDEYQSRISQLLKNENEMYKYKQDLNEIAKERDVDKIRILGLIEKTTKQELEIKNLLNEHHNLNEEMQYYKNKSQTASILTNYVNIILLSKLISKKILC